MLSQRLPEARGPGHQAGHSSDFKRAPFCWELRMCLGAKTPSS